MPIPTTAAPDRLLVALAPRRPEAERSARAAILRLAAECSEVEFDMITNAAENPSGVGLSEVARLSGVTYRQLDYWTRRGWIVPIERTHAGSGHPRTYPPAAVVKARIMGSLVSLFAMAPDRASAIAEEIVETGAAEVGGFRVTRKGLDS